MAKNKYVAMNRIEQYLEQCRVPSVVENIMGTPTQMPPSPAEVRSLIQYLRSKGVAPVIVGSAAAFYHFGGDAKAFRPTVDVDIHVRKKLPLPPDGWRRDPTAIGTQSWISPSGGTVDFLVGKDELPGGIKIPAIINVHQADDEDPDFPVAQIHDVLWMKLNSVREKDLFDAVAIVRKHGLPPKKKGMTQQQAENYDLVQMWVTSRPTGDYGT